MTTPAKTADASDDDAADLALMVEAAREAGEIAMRHFRRKPGISWKGDSSPVTEADLAIDAMLHSRLTAARKDYGWLSEERADDGSRHAAVRCFIIDPIDGTRAFIDETDEWGVSIGLVQGGRPVAGVFHCPARGHTYAARRGGGATRNGVTLSADGREASDVLHIAAPRSISAAIAAAAGRDVRHSHYVPSLALRLALVAEGVLDATLVKPKAAFWDVAAADLILEEAGAALLLPDGSPVDYGARSAKLPAMAAGRGLLLEAMLPVVRTMAIG
jgi:myo-inositol-1(or 4)-monophosphatase